MKRIWIVLMLLFLLLCGCHQKGTAWATGLYDPYYIAEVNVPFADNLNTSQFDRVAELERDDYGRGYYWYRTYSLMQGPHIDIYIISQPTQAEQAAYYPDVCYLIRKENEPELTDEEIAQFKKQNDWNLPIAEEKTYTVSYSKGHKNIANQTEMNNAVLDYLALNKESYSTICNGMERISSHEQLIVAAVCPRSEGGNNEDDLEYYLMVYDIQKEQPISVCQEINIHMPIQEQVSSFRQALIG